MKRLLAFTAIVLAATASACASTGSSGADEPCLLTSSDSAYIGDAALYLDCSVDQPAEPLSTRVSYEPSLSGSRPQPGVSCYSAEIQFVVGMDGRPERDTIRLLRTNNPTLGQALRHSAQDWTYSPAILEGRPVRQLVRVQRGVAVSVRARGSGRPALPPRCR